MTARRLISDDDIVLEWLDAFRASGSIRSACLAVANMARRKRRTIAQVFPPAVVEAARYFGLAPDVLLSDDRAAAVSDPRHVAMWVGRRLGGSTPKLGVAFHRDTSVVRYACLRVERNPELRAMGEEILTSVLGSRARLAAALDKELEA